MDKERESQFLRFELLCYLTDLEVQHRAIICMQGKLFNPVYLPMMNKRLVNTRGESRSFEGGDIF